jgi:hypothetical protein
MMRTLANMMTGMMKVSSYDMLQEVKDYRCYNKRLHKMVDCIDVKVDEGIPAREVYNNESSTEDTAEDEYEQVQESKNKDSKSDEDTDTQTDSNQ